MGHLGTSIRYCYRLHNVLAGSLTCVRMSWAACAAVYTGAVAMMLLRNPPSEPLDVTYI